MKTLEQSFFFYIIYVYDLFWFDFLLLFFFMVIASVTKTFQNKLRVLNFPPHVCEYPIMFYDLSC